MTSKSPNPLLFPRSDLLPSVLCHPAWDADGAGGGAAPRGAGWGRPACWEAKCRRARVTARCASWEAPGSVRRLLLCHEPVRPRHVRVLAVPALPVRNASLSPSAPGQLACACSWRDSAGRRVPVNYSPVVVSVCFLSVYFILFLAVLSTSVLQ